MIPTLANITPTIEACCAAASGWYGSNMKYVFKFGHNPDMDVSGTEDIWSAGGIYAFYPTSGVSIEALSSSASDASAGTGARTILVSGLDENGIEQLKTFTTNGTSTVSIDGSWMRVFRAYVLTSGSAGTNVGNITIRQSGAGATAAHILADEGQTLQAIYTIPKGFNGLLLGGHLSLGKAGDCEARLQIRTPGGAWRTQVHHHSYQAQISMDGCVVASIPALTDIRVNATTTTANTPISADFHLILIDD
jgi:hypothetical protein